MRHPIFFDTLSNNPLYLIKKINTPIKATIYTNNDMFAGINRIFIDTIFTWTFNDQPRWYSTFRITYLYHDMVIMGDISSLEELDVDGLIELIRLLWTDKKLITKMK